MHAKCVLNTMHVFIGFPRSSVTNPAGTDSLGQLLLLYIDQLKTLGCGTSQDARETRVSVSCLLCFVTRTKKPKAASTVAVTDSLLAFLIPNPQHHPSSCRPVTRCPTSRCQNPRRSFSCSLRANRPETHRPPDSCHLLKRHILQPHFSSTDKPDGGGWGGGEDMAKNGRRREDV